MHAIKTRKNHTALKSIYALLLLAGIVCLQTVSAFADDPTRTRLDISNLTFTIGYPTSVNYVSNTVINNQYLYNDVVVPVTLTFTSVSSYINEYFSGRVFFTNNTLFSGIVFKDSFNHTLTIDYFEPIYDNGIYINRVGSALYFDNYHNVNNGNAIIVGYLHFSFLTDANNTNIYPTPNTNSVSASGGEVYVTNYEYGFVRAVIDAINSAADINTMISILESIDVNSGYLPDILTTMQSQYAELYALISRIFATEGNILSVNTSTFNAVNSILNILNNQYNTQESKVADDIEEVDGKLDALAHDIEIVKPNPNNVGDIANDAISAIDTSYNSALLAPIINTRIIGLMLVVVSLGILSYLLYGGH